ncbi:DUF222 domain-containing protein [Egicoccus sp. AB-alg6-2]|uniref:HNH endonuclease signature motif containing protein n=1 Tax=Egicoccus sp. AB-alg6-2 TaxID=3242692 RepID=UPI00359E4383
MFEYPATSSSRQCDVLREHGDHYAVAARTDGDGGDGGDLRRAVHAVAVAAERALQLAADRRDSGGGEIAGLVELLAAIDTSQAAAVELVDRIQTDGLAERRAGLPLEGVLAMQSQATYGDRRFLQTARDVLASMPNLRAAFRAGALGWGQVRAVVLEASALTVALRAELDTRFADVDELRRRNPDEVVDQVQVVAGRLRETLEQQRSVRRFERRYFHTQPALDGGVKGNFLLPGPEGALVIEALQAAAERPTGDRDVTRDAIDSDVDADGAAASGAGRSASGDGADGPAAEGPAAEDGGDPVFDRPRARQLADAFVRLAEAFLAGQRADGTVIRSRPSMLVLTDIRDLVGDSERARRARLLWQLPGAPPALTPAALRRLASDADLQFVLTDDHEVLGISAPVATIPARLRKAVLARDRGCRFPGCQIPAAWVDLHHVRAREHGGPTTLDNLVGLCRRHHVAVTEGRWKLTMSGDGTVTVRRGRHRATSDPPLRRHPLTA